MSNPHAFLFTYLHRELRRRPGQSALIAAGLAIGIGVVVATASASRGVGNAQAQAMHSLYGFGTDLTVTQRPPAHGQHSPQSAAASPQGDVLSVGQYGLLSSASVTRIERLRGVATAAGALTLTDTRLPIRGGLPVTVTIDGLDLSPSMLGPFASAKLTAGRSFAAADSRANVAVVDANYAQANRLAIGSAITIAGARFTVIGIVTQPPASGAADVYIPLPRAQTLPKAGGGDLAGEVDVIYVRASTAALIPTVQKQISQVLPSANVTTASSLANVISGSLANAARLASDLGRWVEIAVLVAAFTAASLLMSGAVNRRVREIGTLKALGWRTRRIVAQITAEATILGLIGAVAGVALGLAGVGVIDALAPTLTAVTTRAQSAGANVAVHLAGTVTAGTVLVAAALALAGALIAGALCAWRTARMRPADALTQPQ